jgi:tyrosinase
VETLAVVVDHPHHAPDTARRPGRELRHRKSVNSLQPEQLAYLREGLAKMMAVGDNRGYTYHAGIHGLPQQLCQHTHLPPQLPLFLPWHRAYLYYFELALRDQVPQAAVTWWDWTEATTHPSGLPDAFAEETIDGEHNPLFDAEVPPIARIDDQPERTFRDTSGPGQLPSAEQIDELLDAKDFRDFSNRLQNFHNGIHGWVGGTMAFVNWAAYDPIFWAHHAMVDRVWRRWQLRHPQGAFPPEYLSQALPPFPMTVGQTLNIHALGYDYAESTSHVVMG